MKRIYALTGLLSLFALGAVAQDDELQKAKAALADMEKGLQTAKVMAIGGAVMGPAVKNAPYSAVEVTETTQMLTDGNRIHQRREVPVYRDTEGRVRRENSPEQVMIWDPVANASYMLNPKTQTAQKMPLGMNVAYSIAGDAGAGGKILTFHADPGAMPPPLSGLSATRVIAGGFTTQTFLTTGKLAPKSEPIGKQTIEGVAADGTRLTSTIEAGAIGNDRPIESVSENWYSPELQTLIKSSHTDPRTGDETFQLTNISRAEPPSTLFQVPPDYRMVYGKMPGGLNTFSAPVHVSVGGPQE